MTNDERKGGTKETRKEGRDPFYQIASFHFILVNHALNLFNNICLVNIEKQVVFFKCTEGSHRH